MRLAGIIVEYNPFHNGHLYHIAETRRLTACDAVVAVMSGNFVQRGEPALLDKWARARMALAAGADAVLELPTFYALQPAEWFACGGVSVLAGVGVDALSFGAEVADLSLLKDVADAWESEPEAVSEAVRHGLAQGKPHPRARAEALAAHFGGEAGEMLGNPNVVLAAMYLRWLERLGCAAQAVPVQRVAAGHHDASITGTIASATAVRRDILSGGALWRLAVPEELLPLMDEALPRLVTAEDFARVLLYLIRMGAELPDTAEGLHRRMAKAARTANTLEEFNALSKSKRYTMARIKRAAMQTLLGISGRDITALRAERPAYARLLGYSRRVDGLVNELANRATIPFVARSAQFAPETEEMQCLWEIDCRASDVYSLAQGLPAGRDFTEKMIQVP